MSWCLLHRQPRAKGSLAQPSLNKWNQFTPTPLKIKKKERKKQLAHVEGGGETHREVRAEYIDDGAVVMQSLGGPYKWMFAACVAGRWWKASYHKPGIVLHPRHSNYDVSGTTAWGVCVVINLRQQRNESNEESGTLNLFNQSISPSPPPHCLSPLEHLNISVTLLVNCDTHLNPFSTSPSLHLFFFAVFSAVLEGA